MKVVVLQSNYIPWRGYFDLINDADVFCFYDEVKYTKNDWRNRNKIYSKNGCQWLTIPIDKNAVKSKISEVIMPNGWQKKHAEILQLTYGRSPYFFQLEKILTDIYSQNQFQLLSEFNQNFITYLSNAFAFKTKFLDSSNFNLQGERITRLVNLLVDIGATEYITGPSAKNYLIGYENMFSDHNVKISYKVYGPYEEYKQLTDPFEPNVSILDLIANVSYENIKHQFNNDHKLKDGKS